MTIDRIFLREVWEWLRPRFKPRGGDYEWVDICKRGDDLAIILHLNADDWLELDNHEKGWSDHIIHVYYEDGSIRVAQLDMDGTNVSREWVRHPCIFQCDLADPDCFDKLTNFLHRTFCRDQNQTETSHP